MRDSWTQTSKSSKEEEEEEEEEEDEDEDEGGRNSRQRGMKEGVVDWQTWATTVLQASAAKSSMTPSSIHHWNHHCPTSSHQRLSSFRVKTTGPGQL